MKFRYALFGALFLSSAAGAVPVLVNGGFETSGATDTGAAGWTRFGTGNSDSVRYSGGSPTPFDTYAMRLNAGGTPRDIGVQQVVSGFVVGEEYTVSVKVGNYAPSFGSPATDDFAIRVLLGTGVDIASASSNSLGLGNLTSTWADFSNTFVADATTLTIQFAAQIVTDRSFVIDNVTLVASDGPPPPGVPAPATLTLLGLGLAWIGYSKRRKIRTI